MLTHIIVISVITTLLSILLRQYRQELALCVSIAGGSVILLMLVPYIKDVLDGIDMIVSFADVDNNYISLIIRVISIAYITEFGAGVARDAGEGAIAMKVELGGKLVIFTLCLPVLLNLIVLVSSMIY